MCWKQEWAMAINNLEHAIEHIKNASNKLNVRLKRNEAALPKSHDKQAVQLLIQKNTQAVEDCGQLDDRLRNMQRWLFRMIEEYGIKHAEKSEKLLKLMGNFKPPTSLEKEDQQIHLCDTCKNACKEEIHSLVACDEYEPEKTQVPYPSDSIFDPNAP